MNIILFVPMIMAQVAFIWLCVSDKTIPTNVTDVLIFGVVVANLVAIGGHIYKVEMGK